MLCSDTHLMSGWLQMFRISMTVLFTPLSPGRPSPLPAQQHSQHGSSQAVMKAGAGGGGHKAGMLPELGVQTSIGMAGSCAPNTALSNLELCHAFLNRMAHQSALHVKSQA
jgi:hypothetical protein